MIVDMSRVIVLGPKRFFGQVIDEVQRLGTLHIDRIESDETPGLSRVQLSEEEARAVQALERALARVNGVLTLLPPGPAPPPQEEAISASVEDVDVEVADVERHVRELTRQRLELEEERTLITSYEGAVRALSPLLAALSGSKAFESIGFILNTKDLTAVAALRNELIKVTDGRVEVVSRMVDENRIGVVVAFRRQDGDRVHPVLSRAGMTELRLPARFAQAQPADTIAIMDRRKAEIPAGIDRLNADLDAIATATRARLLALRAWLADRLARARVVPELAQSHYTFILHGWAPTRTVSEIRGVLRHRFGDDIFVYDSPADPHEARRIPVLLDNHPWVRPFQRLLALFQPPRYGTWDPSPVISITFPIFVGLVIGDAGYGVLLFLLGWYFRTRARRGEGLTIRFLSMSFSPRVLSDMSYLIRAAAFWTIAFGVLYAEAFGNLPELLFHVHPIFNRVERSTQYFLFTIAAGILMVFLGLLVHLIQSIKHRHLAGAAESMVLMLGTGGALVLLGALGRILPEAWAVVGWYLLGGAVAVIVLTLITLRRFVNPLEIFSTFGHVLSHARLMAFGLGAALLPSAANDLGQRVGAAWGVLAWIFLAALGQSLFLVFTIPGHIIQPARLHWVEFLSKFKYQEETGRAYRPFQKTDAERQRVKV